MVIRKEGHGRQALGSLHHGHEDSVALQAVSELKEKSQVSSFLGTRCLRRMLMIDEIAPLQ